MKSEKEIKEFILKLHPNKELDEEGFVNVTDKAGHWIDCLEWVLEL